MNNRNKLILIGLALLLAYGIGRYLQPAKIETRTETIVKEVEVIKRDVEIIKKKKTNPDGTTEEEEITRDKSTETRDKDQKERTEHLVENQKSQYRIRGGIGYDLSDKSQQYVIGGEKRFWGPVSLGLDVTLNNNSSIKAGNVTASFEF